MLLHTEHSLLSLLQGERGVVQKHDFFTEYCLHEENLGKGKYVYTGLKTKRICLVTDCMVANDYSPKSMELVNLQHHVIKEKKIPEKKALVIFANVVEVVERLHKKNIVHRDLKLGNIVLNLRSKKVFLLNDTVPSTLFFRSWEWNGICILYYIIIFTLFR